MRAAITLLVLLFSMCGAQTQSTQTDVQAESQGTAAATAVEVPTEVDIYDELKELRDMVVEQRVLLKFTQEELKVMVAENAVVKERLVASETKVAAVEKVNAQQDTELASVKTENASQQADLVNVKADNAAQQAELEEVKTRLAASEAEVESLETIAKNSKVAFAAGLTNSGYVHAGNSDSNLVFTKIITNVGQAYSSSTGFFTAPVRGVYYFRFTVMDYPSTTWPQVRITKNRSQVLLLADYESVGHVYLSGGVTLQLEVGEAVNMVLLAGRRVFDDKNNHSTFSGFLVFPL